MNFGQGLSELSIISSKNLTEKGSLEKLKYCFNYALVFVGKAYLWRDLVRRGEFVVSKKLDAGTVTLTKGSRTVTGNGTAFVSDMVGWQLRAGDATYEISSSSGQTLILVSKAIKTETAVTYEAWQRYFQIHSDVRLVLPNEDSVYKESPFTIQGQKNSDKYNVSVASIAKDSNVMTGVGTSFLDNVRNGDLINIQSKEFHVFNVESDTKIIMTNFADEELTFSASFLSETSYLADMKNPADEDELVKYRYLRHLFSLVHDDDLTGLPNTFDSTILNFAFAEYKKISNLSYLPESQIAQLSLETLKSNSNLVIEPFYSFPPKIHAGMGRGVSRRLSNG